jgi:hypothetical protein
MSSRHVLTIGFHPEVPGPITAAERRAQLSELEARLEANGYLMDTCLLMNQSQDEASIEAALRAKPYACVCITASLRLAPHHTQLFERVVNVVHRCAPTARFCFHLSPTDVVAAVQRATAGHAESASATH